MAAWFACMNNVLTSVFGAIAAVALSILFTIVVGLGLCAYGAGSAGLAACAAAASGGTAILVGMIFGFAVVILVLLATNCFLTSRRAAPGTAAVVPTLVGTDGRQPDKPWDCDRAQGLRAQAEAALAAAAAAQASAQAAVAQARQRLNLAFAAEAGAIAALVAAAFQPWLLAGAIAAAAAATALVATLALSVVAAETALAAAKATLLRAIADKSAAEALVVALCGVSSTPTQPGILDGHISVGAGLLTP